MATFRERKNLINNKAKEIIENMIISVDDLTYGMALEVMDEAKRLLLNYPLISTASNADERDSDW